MRKFHEVENWAKRTDGKVTLPIRATIGSAGYDFCANADYKIKPNEIAKIWTDVKAEMNENEVLLLNIRSSMGGKFMLSTVVGIIDQSYFSNENNDGNIGAFLLNVSNETQYIKKGDRICQGIFTRYLTTYDDHVTQKRSGGFGSTN